MSRAFVKEDYEPPPADYRLPDPKSPGFDEACARALIAGANDGDTRGAERATGRLWGEARLIPHVEAILKRAEAEDQARIAQLCRRFLGAADPGARVHAPGRRGRAP